MPYVTWAFDAGNYALYQPNFLRIAHLGKALTVPEKMGAINQGFQGKGRTVVCIQDLHCNYEVQKNIAGIIQHLVKKHGLKLVGEEGAFHTVDTSPISAFPIRKVREEVSDYFVKQGKITGAEHYSAISGGSIQLEGIETPELYQASRQAVRSFLNAESQGYCYDLRDILDELKAKVYNPLLIKFDRKRTAYREGYMDILKYSAYLRHTARRLKLDLSAYSNLERFLSLKQNFFSSQVDPDQLFKELDKLDTDIRQHLYTSDTQQELDELYTRLDIIERLLNISVSQEELQAFRTQRKKYTIKEFVNFINTVGVNGGSPLRPDPEMHVLDEYLKQVDDFYRLADERSLHFVDNLVRKMDRFNEKLAVMINGGFHTDKVLAELKRRNITYVSIRPRLTRQDVVNPYFSLLQDRKTPLEKLLAKNQTIMAVRTLLLDSSVPTLLQRIFRDKLGIYQSMVALARESGDWSRVEKMINILNKKTSICIDVEKFKAVNLELMAKNDGQPLNSIVIPMTIEIPGQGYVNVIACPQGSKLAGKLGMPMERAEINGIEYIFKNSLNKVVLTEILKNQRVSLSAKVSEMAKNMKPVAWAGIRTGWRRVWAGRVAGAINAIKLFKMSAIKYLRRATADNVFLGFPFFRWRQESGKDMGKEWPVFSIVFTQEIIDAVAAILLGYVIYRVILGVWINFRNIIIASEAKPSGWEAYRQIHKLQVDKPLKDLERFRKYQYGEYYDIHDALEKLPRLKELRNDLDNKEVVEKIKTTLSSKKGEPSEEEEKASEEKSGGYNREERLLCRVGILTGHVKNRVNYKKQVIGTMEKLVISDVFTYDLMTSVGIRVQATVLIIEKILEVMGFELVEEEHGIYERKSPAAPKDSAATSEKPAQTLNILPKQQHDREQVPAAGSEGGISDALRHVWNFGRKLFGKPPLSMKDYEKNTVLAVLAIPFGSWLHEWANLPAERASIGKVEPVRQAQMIVIEYLRPLYWSVLRSSFSPVRSIVPLQETKEKLLKTGDKEFLGDVTNRVFALSPTSNTPVEKTRKISSCRDSIKILQRRQSDPEKIEIFELVLKFRMEIVYGPFDSLAKDFLKEFDASLEQVKDKDKDFVLSAKQFADLVRKQLATQSRPEESSADIEKKDDVPDITTEDAIGYLADNGYLRTSTQGKPLFTHKLGKEIIEQAEAKAEVLRRGEKPKVTVNINDIEYLLEFTSHSRIKSIEVAGQKIEFGEDENQYNFSRLQKPAKVDFDKAVDFLCCNGYVEISRDQKIFATEKLNEEVKLQINTGLSFNTIFKKQEKIILNGISYHFQIKPLGKRIIIKELRIAGKEMALKNVLENQEFAKTVPRASANVKYQPGGISDALRHVWNFGRKLFGKPPLTMGDYEKNADFRENVLVLIFGSALTVLLAVGPPLLGFPGLFTPQEMFNFGFSGGWLVFLASHIGLKTKPQNRIWALILTGVNIFLLQLNVTTPFFTVVFIITFLNHNLLNSLAKIANKLKLAKTKPAAESDIQNQRALVFTKIGEIAKTVLFMPDRIVVFLFKLPSWVRTISPRTWASTAVVIAVGIFAITGNVPGLIMAALLIASVYNFEVGNRLLAYIPRVIRKAISNISSEKYEVDLNIYSSREGDKKVTAGTNLLPKEPVEGMPATKPKIDDVIWDIWDENQKGKFPEGIELTAYPEEYGEFGIYYLIKDIQDKLGYQAKVSPETLPRKINKILNQTIYKKQVVSLERFFVIKIFLKDKFADDGALKRYGNQNGEGLAMLVEEAGKPGSAYAVLDGINIGSLTYLLNSKTKVAGILGIDATQEQLTNWNMPRVDMTWEQFRAIRKILREKLYAGTLKEYGDKGGEGLVTLLSEIESGEGEYAVLRGIHIGHLTGLLNSKTKVAGILGIDAQDELYEQLTNWNMPYISMKWKQFKAIREILKEKLDAGTLHKYGDEGGEGLVTLLSEIESGEGEYAVLRGINITSLTSLLNSKTKVAGILGIDARDEQYEQLTNWNMPSVYMTWEQFKAIRKILKEKLDAGTLHKYGDEGGEGLVTLLGEIESREGAYAVLRDINIGSLTSLLNSKTKVAGILGINAQDEQLSNWNMPCVNMKWEQFKTMQEILKEKLDAGTLKEYGDKGGEGLVKLFGEIESGKGAYAVLRGIHIGHLTGLLNSKTKVAGILGIDTTHEQLRNWNMPYVQMKWKQFEAKYTVGISRAKVPAVGSKGGISDALRHVWNLGRKFFGKPPLSMKDYKKNADFRENVLVLIFGSALTVLLAIGPPLLGFPGLFTPQEMFSFGFSGGWLVFLASHIGLKTKPQNRIWALILTGVNIFLLQLNVATPFFAVVFIITFLNHNLLNSLAKIATKLKLAKTEPAAPSKGGFMSLGLDTSVNDLLSYFHNNPEKQLQGFRSLVLEKAPREEGLRVQFLLGFVIPVIIGDLLGYHLPVDIGVPGGLLGSIGGSITGLWLGVIKYAQAHVTEGDEVKASYYYVEALKLWAPYGILAIIFILVMQTSITNLGVLMFIGMVCASGYLTKYMHAVINYTKLRNLEESILSEIDNEENIVEIVRQVKTSAKDENKLPSIIIEEMLEKDDDNDNGERKQLQAKLAKALLKDGKYKDAHFMAVSAKQAPESLVGIHSNFIKKTNKDRKKLLRTPSTSQEKVEYCGMLTKQLKKNIPIEQAKNMADTLLRLKEPAIRLLEEEEVLDSKQAKLLQKQRWTSDGSEAMQLFESDLPKRLIKLYQSYIDIDQEVPAETISRLVATHLVPVSFIRRLQRTYRLGYSDFELINKVLLEPDIEAEVLRKRSEEEPAGELIAENLKLYNPKKMPVLTWDERMALIETLEIDVKVLSVLVKNNEQKRFAYELKSGNIKDILAKLEPDADFSRLKEGQVLISEGNRMQLRITEISKIDGNTFLRLQPIDFQPGQEFPENGHLLTEIPSTHEEIYLEIMETLLEALKSSSGRRTKRKFLDYLFGLEEMETTKLPLKNVLEEEYHNPLIRDDKSEQTAVNLPFGATLINFLKGAAGTAKTTVVSEIAYQAMLRGLKVLVVGEMHTSVDHLLASFEELPVFRIANNKEKVDDRVQRRWTGNKKTGIRLEALKNFEEKFRKFGSKGRIIGGTAAGLAMFLSDSENKREFLQENQVDMVIVEESTLASLPAVIAILSHLKDDGKLVVIGSQKQFSLFGFTAQETRNLKKAGIKPEEIKTYCKNAFDRLLKKCHGNVIQLSEIYRAHPLLGWLDETISNFGRVRPHGWLDYDTDTMKLIDISDPDEPKEFHEKEDEKTEEPLMLDDESDSKMKRFVRARERKGISTDQITIIAADSSDSLLVSEIRENLTKAFRKEATKITIKTGQEADALNLPNTIFIAGKRPVSYKNDCSANKDLELVRHYHKQAILKGEEFSLKQITIVTPYRAQAKLLREKLQAAFPGLDVKKLPIVSTVRSYMGDENDIVIVDLVRSNPEGIWGIVSSVRLLYVARTRARKSLVVVFDQRTFLKRPSEGQLAYNFLAWIYMKKLVKFYQEKILAFFPDPNDPFTDTKTTLKRADERKISPEDMTGGLGEANGKAKEEEATSAPEETTEPEAEVLEPPELENARTFFSNLPGQEDIAAMLRDELPAKVVDLSEVDEVTDALLQAAPKETASQLLVLHGYTLKHLEDMETLGLTPDNNMRDSCLEAMNKQLAAEVENNIQSVHRMAGAATFYHEAKLEVRFEKPMTLAGITYHGLVLKITDNQIVPKLNESKDLPRAIEGFIKKGQVEIATSMAPILIQNISEAEQKQWKWVKTTQELLAKAQEGLEAKQRQQEGELAAQKIADRIKEESTAANSAKKQCLQALTEAKKAVKEADAASKLCAKRAVKVEAAAQKVKTASTWKEAEEAAQECENLFRSLEQEERKVRTAMSKVRAAEKSAASYDEAAEKHYENCQNLVSDTKKSAAGGVELVKVGKEALRTSRAATQTAGEAVKTISELVPDIETVATEVAQSLSQAQQHQNIKNEYMQKYQIAHDFAVQVKKQSQAAVQAVRKCSAAINQAENSIDTAKKNVPAIKKLSVQLAGEVARVREQEPGLKQVSLPIREIDENFASVEKKYKKFKSSMKSALAALNQAKEQWEFARTADEKCQTTMLNIRIDSNPVLRAELVTMAASASAESSKAVLSVVAEINRVSELSDKATTIVSTTSVTIEEINKAHAFLDERWQPKQNPERHAACLAILNSREFTEWLQISGVTDAGLLPHIDTEIQEFLKEQEDLENRSWEGTPSWVDSNYQDIINEYNQMLEAIKQADPEKYTRKQHEDNLLALNKLCDRALVYLHFLDTMAALNLVSEGKIDERHFSDRQLFKKMQELGKQVRKQGILLNQARCHLILFAYMIKLLDAIELKLIAPASAIAKSGFEKGKLSAALESLSEHLEEVFNANNKSEIPALKNTLAKMYGRCLQELRRLSQDLKTEKLSDTYEIKAEVITNMDRITSVVPYDLQMFWEGRVRRNRIAYKQQIDAVIRACKSVFASLMIISPDFDLDRYFEVKEEVGSSSADFELLFPGIDEYLLRKLISPKDMKAIIKRIKKAVKDRVIKIFVREGARKQNEYLMALAKEFGIPHDPRKPSKTVVVIDKMIRGKDSGKIIEKAEKVLSGISDETESDVLTKYLKTGVIGGKSALLRMWTFRQFPDMAPQKYTKLRLVFIEAGWALFLGGVVMAGLWGLSMLGSPLLADWFPIDTIIGQLQSTFKIALILFPVLHLDRVFNWILDRAPPLNRILGPVLRTDTPTPWLNAVIAANISALASISLQAFSPVLGLMIGMLVFIVSHAAVNQYLNIPSGLAEHSKYYQRNISEPQPNESPFEPVIEQTCEDFRDRLFGKYFKIKENVKYGIAPLLRVQTRIKDEEAEKNRKTDVAFDEKFFDTNTEYWIEMPAWAWKMALNNNKGLLPGMGRAFMRIWLGTALWTLVITRKLRFYLMALGFFSRKDMVMKQAVERQRESLRPIEKTVRPLARKNLTIGWDALLRLIEEHTGVPLADRQALEASFSPEAELQARKDRGNTLKKQSQLLQHRSGGALVGWVARQKNTLAAMLAQDTAEAAEAYKLMADHALTAATARRHSLDFLQEYGDELESVSLAAVPKMASTLLKHIKQQGLEVDAGLLAILREMDRPEVKTGDIVTLDKSQVYSLLKSSREWTAKADLQAVDAVNMGKDYFGRQVCVVATSQQIYEYTFADPKGVKTTFYLPTVGTAIGNKKETFEDIVAKVKSGKQPVQRFAGRFLGKSAEPEAKFRGWQQWSLWLGGNSTHKGIARKNPSAYFNMLIIRLEALMPKGTVAPLIRELERRDSDLHRMVMAVLEARDEKTALLAQKQLARNLAAFITNYYKLFKVEYTEKNVDLLAENMLNILAFSSLAELLDPIMVVEKEYATPETYGSLSGILVKMLEKRGIKPGKLSVPFIMLGLYGTRGALHDMIKKHNYEVRKGLEFIRRVIRFYAGSA